MDCIICGNWFSSAIHNGACPAYERAIKRLGLNMMPEWVEWLMGYPPGWTDLNA